MRPGDYMIKVRIIEAQELASTGATGIMGTGYFASDETRACVKITTFDRSLKTSVKQSS